MTTPGAVRGCIEQYAGLALPPAGMTGYRMKTTRIDRIFRIINEFGDHHYGEAISQIEHVLQCGHLARTRDCSPAMVAASLLHDIGQFIDDAGNAAEHKGIDARHEVTGAAFLSPFFAPDVTEPVRLHVDAKRYLCAVEPGYAEGLSGASLLSLQLQGGAMNPDEVDSFRSNRWFEDALQLRRFDDLGKRKDWQVPDLETYRSLLEGLLLPEG
ncbi:HD domain-containing protein [Novosphingobium sp. EMRT-2]|uniref:HD domain-containing protein n=1 Tax=Novosphingobium sp. EMRT-2 TaxID=2571749 RepID=UPI0021026297|nr:phosphohydrolase [Novosphingobium sp. EMRT-2]